MVNIKRRVFLFNGQCKKKRGYFFNQIRLIYCDEYKTYIIHTNNLL